MLLLKSMAKYILLLICLWLSEKRLPISTDHGNNTIVINGNEIKIVDADCKDALCIKQGSISKIGKTLICLPNELIIEIKGDEYDSSDDLILSH